MSTYENETGRLAPQTLLQHRYLIVSLAGRGGMSAVYQAVDMRFGNRRVAIKEMSQSRLSNEELAEATARFEREAHLLGSLSHPNLPNIYDAFSEQGRSYLVMEYIEGKTLLELLRENGGRALPVAQVLTYARQLCDVLAYLHSHNPPIIFRDLKPSNVMVTENEHVYLIDFGIARFFKEGQQQDTVFLGSPGYAPPEQHGISQTNQRSDLYALGATLHCCLTGKDPYRAGYDFVFPPVRQYNPQVPVGLDQLIQRLLANDEWQRPASAVEVQQELIKISQQASEHTTGFSPAMASAPTEYNPPARPSNIFPAPPAYSSMTPATIAAPHPRLDSVVPTVPQQRRDFVPRPSSPWSIPFIALFSIILLLLIAGSIWTFNIEHPYGSGNHAGLDHAVELGLSLFLLLVLLVASTIVRSFAARTILLVASLPALVAGLAFTIQTLNDMGTLPANSLQQLVPNSFLTVGLAGVALVSLLWLLRPFPALDRVILFGVFGIAIACALLQFSYGDGDVPKHLYLLVALITAIQGVLLATQMERVRKGMRR